MVFKGFPGSSVVKNPPTNAGDFRDAGSVSGLGRSPGEGNGNPLQYSCLGNLMDREGWWATVHEAPKSQTRPSDSRHARAWYLKRKNSNLNTYTLPPEQITSLNIFSLPFYTFYSLVVQV